MIEDQPLIGSAHDHSPQDRAILMKVRQGHDSAERLHKVYRSRWDDYYGLHRNYRRLVTSHAQAESENDRDDVVRDAQREWGAELFIPYVFTVIETVTPRILLNDPQMLVRPKKGKVEKEQADRLKYLFDDRQQEIGYALRLQPTVRRGLKFGLGAQKVFWDKQTRMRPVMEQAMPVEGEERPPYMVANNGALREVVIDEGPQVEDVDVYDFFWDPAAKDISTCRFVIHRTWRDMGYIRRKVESGAWRQNLDLKRIEGLGSEGDRGEIWAERMKAAGLSDFDTRQGRLHEVWEWHDGESVHTVLDKALVVQSQANPYLHRELPFQIYRPTMQEGEFVGIGEIEPIAHLQYELNTLRSQRRDNATLVLQKAFMYTEGLVDPADLVIGPGVGIPVSATNLDEVIKPIMIGEIPASGYEEESALKSDIEMTSGISDPVAGGEGGGSASSETATGIQLVQAAANVRIRHKTKNLEWETIRPAAGQFLELWRQHMKEEVTVMIEDPAEATGFRFEQVTPADVHAPLMVIPASGSTEPENTPQKRNDALALYNQFSGNEQVDQRKLALHLLRENDIADPEAFLVEQEPRLDPRIVNMALAQVGVDEEQAEQVMAMSLAVDAQMKQGQNGAAPEEPDAG